MQIYPIYTNKNLILNYTTKINEINLSETN